MRFMAIIANLMIGMLVQSEDLGLAMAVGARHDTAIRMRLVAAGTHEVHGRRGRQENRPVLLLVTAHAVVAVRQ